MPFGIQLHLLNHWVKLADTGLIFFAHFNIPFMIKKTLYFQSKLDNSLTTVWYYR